MRYVEEALLLPKGMLTCYVQIEKKISELGGKKVLDKTAERTHGWFANYVDPEGNRFGVFEVNQADSGAM